MNAEKDHLKDWQEFYHNYQQCNKGNGHLKQVYSSDNTAEVSLLLDMAKNQIREIFASCGITENEIGKTINAIWKVERQYLGRIIVMFESFKSSKLKRNVPEHLNSDTQSKLNVEKSVSTTLSSLSPVLNKRDEELGLQNNLNMSTDKCLEEQDEEISISSNSVDSVTDKRITVTLGRKSKLNDSDSESFEPLCSSKSKKGKSTGNALLGQKGPEVRELSKKPRSRNTCSKSSTSSIKHVNDRACKANNSYLKKEKREETEKVDAECKSKFENGSNNRDEKVNPSHRCRRGRVKNDVAADCNMETYKDDHVIPSMIECPDQIHGTSGITGHFDEEKNEESGEVKIVDKESDSNQSNYVLADVSDNESDGNKETLLEAPVKILKDKKKKFESKSSPKMFGSMVLSERTDGEIDSNVPMICSMCRQHFPESKDLLLHWKKEHKDSQGKLPKRFLCEACGKALHSPAKLKLHYRIHSGARPHPCQICGKSFRVLKALIAHIRTHTQEKPYRCQFCPKAFSEKKVLTHHERTHTGERSHVCEWCGKLFQNLTALNTHKRIHTGEKPYSCDICGDSFNQSGTLKSHKRVHTGDKPYFCEFCGLSFSNNSQLVSHRRTHTGERPYKCDHCDFTACTGTRVRQHAVIHSDLKPFVCDVPSCSAAFKRKSHLKSHARTHFKEKSPKSPECDVTYSETSISRQDISSQEFHEGDTMLSKPQLPAVPENQYVVQVFQTQNQPHQESQFHYQYQSDTKSSVTLSDVDIAEVYSLAYK